MSRVKRTTGKAGLSSEGAPTRSEAGDGFAVAKSGRGVGAYVRVSSAAQTAASQRDAVSRACEARGCAIDVWFADTASGATLKRPGLAQVRQAARAGRLRELWVYRLDRLTRSGIADTLSLLRELRGAGCEVRSVADGLPDAKGPLGDILEAVLAWAAEVERVVIRERQDAARKRLEASGGAWGRPPRLTPERAAWFARQLEHKSARALEVETGVSRSTILRCRDRASRGGRFKPSTPLDRVR